MDSLGYFATSTTIFLEMRDAGLHNAKSDTQLRVHSTGTVSVRMLVCACREVCHGRKEKGKNSGRG